MTTVAVETTDVFVSLSEKTHRMYMMTPSDHISHDLSYVSGPRTSGADIASQHSNRADSYRQLSQWVISLFCISPFIQRNCYVYSQASSSKFILIIFGIYMYSSIYYYYTEGERSDADV